MNEASRESGPITIALAGNPNSGKTTLFNALTGSHQHVGNYPGVTVEKKEGFAAHQGVRIHVIDLPGTYSLTAYSQEELVARNYLAEERPAAVVDVINAGSLERNLYLCVQFLELGIPLILALNMMDEARSKGMTLNTDLLAKRLHAPVVETIARHGQGKNRLLREIVELTREGRRPWRPLTISYGPDLDPVLTEMTARIEAESFLTDRYPARWTALKYLEGDEEITLLGRKAGALGAVLESSVKTVAEHCRKTLNTYPEAIIADYRYGFIASLLKGVLTHDTHAQRIAVSDQMDKVLTHTFLGPSIMALLLFGIYELTFTLGQTPMDWVEAFFSWLGSTVTGLMPPGLLRSMLVSGVIDGVGGVLGFVPLIAIMFFCIAFLEDSGYMARIAYMLDRVFRIFGLHGCSVMPFIVSGGIAGGCAVPGVMASRTLRSPREKLATLLTAPFMTCGAKLPLFILLSGIFFPSHQASALFVVTLTGWAAALVVARILRSTVIRGPATPFVMELPPYRWPTLRGMCIHTWERTWEYIKKAGTVILAISILIWAAMTFPQLPESRVQEFEIRAAELEADGADQEVLTALENERGQAALLHSMAGRLGVALEPISRLAGFDWKINIALTGGFAAKEVIISTLGTAYSLGEGEVETESLGRRISKDPNWDLPRAVSLMLFVLLYAPCFVTIVAIARESGSWGWALFSLGFNTVFAFALAVSVYQGLSLIR
ncbi:MAG: ferrous iron transport protein B [Deltaproteobacteria bacterium]|nr:ferrous iron transport protein B [Deltaproteobacteria bacterium]